MAPKMSASLVSDRTKRAFDSKEHQQEILRGFRGNESIRTCNEMLAHEHATGLMYAAPLADLQAWRGKK